MCVWIIQCSGGQGFEILLYGIDAWRKVAFNDRVEVVWGGRDPGLVVEFAAQRVDLISGRLLGIGCPPGRDIPPVPKRCCTGIRNAERGKSRSPRSWMSVRHCSVFCWCLSCFYLPVSSWLAGMSSRKRKCDEHPQHPSMQRIPT